MDFVFEKVGPDNKSPPGCVYTGPDDFVLEQWPPLLASDSTSQLFGQFVDNNPTD